MRPRGLGDVAEVVGGSLRGGEGAERTVRGVTIDSRRTGPGDLFFALHGERDDGHRFVPAALNAGAAGAVVARDRSAALRGRPLVEVGDPARALLDLARDERSRMDWTVIGITGSTGKTCTKDFVAATLATRFPVVASPASFNNEIGLPLTILAAGEDTRAVVCEMGSRGPGHIRMLCEVARPRVGVVTNVGVAHMELFGTPEVLRASKAELPEALGADGIAVLNADDPVVLGYRARTRATTILYGTAPSAGVRAEEIHTDRDSGRSSFELVTPDGAAPVRLSVPGEHMVWNALAAGAVGWALGVPVEDAAVALSSARVSRGRMEPFETAGGIRVLDDSYNANPTSMAAALRAARWMAGGGRCIAVLGPMAELGPVSVQEHLRVGELVARLGVDELIVVSPDARLIGVGAEREGVDRDRIHWCEDVDHAARVVRVVARSGDLVLVKASRAAGLDRLASTLRAPDSADVRTGAGA